MKKLTAMLLILSFAVMIVGCGEDAGTKKKDSGTGSTKPPATDTKK